MLNEHLFKPCTYLSIWFILIAVCHPLFTLEVDGAFRT